ncbi:MAG: hypothetical protein K2J63_00795 [Muribaculaceae bacterium]|nr:hypothetical protein [Muribaculaceae bacterium]
MSPIYTETCFLSAGEANPEQELSLPILMAKLIDIATAHANSLGIGNPSMTNLKAGWVLSRVTIEMQSYPRVNDTYCISTWMVSFNRHFSERDFCISSPGGEIYGYARSIWMVMSTIDHSNVGLSHFTLSDELIKGTPAPIERQAKHGLIISSENTSDTPGGTLLATHPVFDYRFQYCDLDSYRHVNTVRYVTLLLNRYSLDTFDTSFVKRLELSFMHEARYGMDTQLLRHDDESGKSSFLLREKEGQPLFYARMMFCPYPSK